MAARTMRQNQAEADPGDPLYVLPEHVQKENQKSQGLGIQDMLKVYTTVNPSRAEDVAVERHSRFRALCRRILHHRWFETIMGYIIFTDLLLIAVEVDNQDAAPVLFDLIALFSTLLFTAELVVRVGARARSSPFSDRLLIFDAIIIGFSVLDLQFRFAGALTALSAISALRVFRLIRVARLGKFLSLLTPLVVLGEAIVRSLHPLFFISVVAGMLIFAFAITITMLVPAVAAEGEAEKRIALEFYGSVWKSCLSLMQAMAGSPQWGADTVFGLLQSDGYASIVLLMVMITTTFILLLALNGLVTGVFMEQLVASDALNKFEDQNCLRNTRDTLIQLTCLFSDKGFASNDDIIWADVKKCVEGQEKHLLDVGVGEETLKRVFQHVAEEGNGYVVVEQFIYGIFKLLAISKSAEMLSIDYQQEKALQQLGALNQQLQQSSNGLQVRLNAVRTTLFTLEEDIRKLQDSSDEVQAMEALLYAKRKYRQEVAGGSLGRRLLGRKRSGPDGPKLSVDELNSNYELNRRLCELEDTMTRLRAGPTMTASSTAAIADGIVQSTKQALSQALAAARAATDDSSRKTALAAVAAGLAAATAAPAADAASPPPPPEARPPSIALEGGRAQL